MEKLIVRAGSSNSTSRSRILEERQSDSTSLLKNSGGETAADSGDGEREHTTSPELGRSPIGRGTGQRRATKSTCHPLPGPKENEKQEQQEEVGHGGQARGAWIEHQSPREVHWTGDRRGRSPVKAPVRHLLCRCTRKSIVHWAENGGRLIL